MAKIGDTQVSGGIQTTVTNIDPETGQITWDVDYTADYKRLFKEITQLMNTAKEVADATGEAFFMDHYNDIRKRRNELRTYLRNNKKAEYERIKGMNEMSGAGGAASFTAGAGPQYATPFAFKKKKKVDESNPGASLGKGPKATEKGVQDNYYYKLGWKPVAPPHSTKGVEVKYLWGKK
jgi:hypothetical protein